MRPISNSGQDRVIDHLNGELNTALRFDFGVSELSLFAFHMLSERFKSPKHIRIALGKALNSTLATPTLLGSEQERPYRNSLLGRYFAKEFLRYLLDKVELRVSDEPLPQSMYITKNEIGGVVLVGSCPCTTEGFGLTPAPRHALIQYSSSQNQIAVFAEWFESQWQAIATSNESRESVLASVRQIACLKTPQSLYQGILHALFSQPGERFDESAVIKSGTGFQHSAVWNKLFRFQRDGVLGIIEKLEKLGGCILADSVGLGKTFEALAVIKYYELRNDRVLVLAPKRLRDNWTLYKANDKRNILSRDRFHYDVLNHTDLSRDHGNSGDIDLTHVNWGNYDLVVIDESHNFRNKITHKDRESRYGCLMRKIIQEGVKTRVLMLSATPVNNRLSDLRNQISFVTEGSDDALHAHGIASIQATTHAAQQQFNKWLKRSKDERTTATLVDTLGFDYFKLLDLLTIARSRKHIGKYYGLAETGKFPERLKPINIKPDVDVAGIFESIRKINDEIRRLNLGVYAPLRYVMPNKKDAYDKKYRMQVRGGEGFFRQADREESLVHLLRVNVLKRMESSVVSFALTVERQLRDIDAIIQRLDHHEVNAELEEVDIADISVDDPTFESLLVGKKIKVLLQDVDVLRWKQDLLEDRNRLANLHGMARSVTAQHDAKLIALQEHIAAKIQNPVNPGNRKVIVFTAFADTASYLYRELAPWMLKQFGLHTALVIGSGSNQCTLPGLGHDLGSLLSAFAPRAKERPAELAAEGDIELLIATDCISEGQNLQDCDTLVNYDIHWNPVRIIQRFGRIDRIGSPNDKIQLVNFWPNMELEEYINLEARVSGKMVLLDVSATGEENVIEVDPSQNMNDLEYRREQLLHLQEAVPDLEDLNTAISITDLNLHDYRMDLARLQQNALEQNAELPLGALAFRQAKAT